mmetsp:Transcript_1214/g.2765  ORF Transcript_1214/g.2765 Transcript_1214/m.2765 type:complete len:434 (+) Transcript_1214:14-1315(+)
MAETGEAAQKRPKGSSMSPTVLLGSSSKWRRAIFARHFPECGSDFLSPDIDEKAIRAEKPEEMCMAIARAKADALAPKVKGRDVLLVCMDQVVSCDGQIREKPETEAEARQFLESYRQGKHASFINGMVVLNAATGRCASSLNSSKALWKNFPDEVVDALIKKGDLFTCAGGVVVEDELLQPYLRCIEGTEDSVQGLPLKPLRMLLARAQAPAVTHVIFDMDGLLLDTESSYSVAQQEILDRWNRKFTWDLKAKMMGKKALDACQICIDELELSDLISAEDFLAEREKRLEVLFAKAALMPGVARLVRHLHRSGVPMAVATSSHRRHYDLKTSLHRELFGLMHHVVTGDQVSKSKPDPQIFSHAASLFDGMPAADTILVFEDAPSGVEAGLAAGMQVCHVPDINLSRDLCGQAHCELLSLEDFRPEDWGLPPF